MDVMGDNRGFIATSGGIPTMVCGTTGWTYGSFPVFNTVTDDVLVITPDPAIDFATTDPTDLTWTVTQIGGANTVTTTPTVTPIGSFISDGFNFNTFAGTDGNGFYSDAIFSVQATQNVYSLTACNALRFPPYPNVVFAVGWNGAIDGLPNPWSYDSVTDQIPIASNPAFTAVHVPISWAAGALVVMYVFQSGGDASPQGDVAGWTPIGTYVSGAPVNWWWSIATGSELIQMDLLVGTSSPGASGEAAIYTVPAGSFNPAVDYTVSGKTGVSHDVVGGAPGTVFTAPAVTANRGDTVWWQVFAYQTPGTSAPTTAVCAGPTGALTAIHDGTINLDQISPGDATHDSVLIMNFWLNIDVAGTAPTQTFTFDGDVSACHITAIVVPPV